MLIKDIKRMHISELLEKASALNIENAANLSRQELVYGILQAQARISGEIWGEGVLETLPEGFGFLRSIDYNYLPSPDDIYVSPSQIKRFNLRTGDTVYGLCLTYGLSYENNITFLQRLNNRDNLATYYVGQTIYMPLYVAG